VDRSGQALSGSAERRRSPRVRASLEVAYEDADRQVFLRTRDLSESGVYLIAADPPQPGVRAQVTFDLPGSSAFVRLRGTVARRDDGSPTGFAIAFDPARVPKPTRRALRAFVDGTATAPE
jgi:hypothetical protein